MVAFLSAPPFMSSTPSELIVTVSSDVTNLILKSLFSSADWLSSKNKRVIINSGVTISASALDGAVRAQAASESTPWGGILTLQNSGTIQGIGGAANSGVGGDAIFSGTYTSPGSKMVVNNLGTIRAGGGGGGQGGAGSASTSLREPSSGESYSLFPPVYGWNNSTDSGNVTRISWNNSIVSSTPDFGETQKVVGIYTYFRGSQRSSSGGTTAFGVYRTSTQTTSTTGGNGGRGQGSDGVAAAGSAGGTNAGAGGAGGSWGAQGSTGAAGNVGSGTAGGLAGVAYSSAIVTITNSGTIQGRVL